MALGDEKFISFTTFRRSGTEVSTPTWIVPLDGERVGFWTSSATGKYKRLRNNPKVIVQPANGRGRVKPGSVPVEGTAELVTAGPDFDTIQRDVRAKYGAQVPITRWLSKIGHIGKGPFPYGDVGIVITPVRPE